MDAIIGPDFYYGGKVPEMTNHSIDDYTDAVLVSELKKRGYCVAKEANVREVCCEITEDEGIVSTIGEKEFSLVKTSAAISGLVRMIERDQLVRLVEIKPLLPHTRRWRAELTALLPE